MNTKDVANRIFYELERKRLLNVLEPKENAMVVIKMVLDSEKRLRTEEEGKEL